MGITTRARPQPHPFLDTTGPIGFAHRGGSGEMPENTMPAFAAAIAMGYCYLETDVHLTRDGVVVICHDDNIDRVSDRRGLIGDLSLAELTAADAGYNFLGSDADFPFRGQRLRIPTLAELLDAFPDARLNIDIKSDAVVAPLMHLLFETKSLDRVCLGSFSDRRLSQVRRIGGAKVCTSMGPRQVAAARVWSLLGRIPHRNGNCIQVPKRQAGIPLANRSWIRAAHRSDLAVHVWTVNDVAIARHLLDAGVDGIMSDRPSMLVEVFAERDLAVNGTKIPKTPTNLA